MQNRIKFGSPRVVLLMEIERYCREANCLKLNRIGLTKDEARNYVGFACEKCEAWNDDALAEKDVPDWWSEIKPKDSQLSK